MATIPISAVVPTGLPLLVLYPWASHAAAASYIHIHCAFWVCGHYCHTVCMTGIPAKLSSFSSHSQAVTWEAWERGYHTCWTVHEHKLQNSSHLQIRLLAKNCFFFLSGQSYGHQRSTLFVDHHNFAFFRFLGLVFSLLCCLNYIEIFFVLTWRKFLFMVKLKNAADQVWKTRGCYIMY